MKRNDKTEFIQFCEGVWEQVFKRLEKNREKKNLWKTKRQNNTQWNIIYIIYIKWHKECYKLIKRKKLKKTILSSSKLK